MWPRIALLAAGSTLAWLLTSCANPGGTVGTSCSQGPTAQPVAASSSTTVGSGRVVLTEAASGETVTVPRGTIIEVDLTTHAYGPWRVPTSSDPNHLPRLSGSAACDGTATASFRAEGSGDITAVRGNQEVTQRFVVSIVVAS